MGSIYVINSIFIPPGSLQSRGTSACHERVSWTLSSPPSLTLTDCKQKCLVPRGIWGKNTAQTGNYISKTNFSTMFNAKQECQTKCLHSQGSNPPNLISPKRSKAICHGFFGRSTSHSSPIRALMALPYVTMLSCKEHFLLSSKI